MSRFRLFLRAFATANAIFAVLLFALKHPSLSTPLYEFSLLAALHALVLGSLLPLLFDRFYIESRVLRVASLFVCTGEIVIVLGFMIHPRSPLPSEGGVLVATGIILAISLLRGTTGSSIYWIALAGSSVMGIVLGQVLVRPFIDPIPFSLMSVHGLLGMALGLFPLFWKREEAGKRVWKSRTLVLFLFFSLMLVLRHHLLTWMIIPLLLCILVLSALGIVGWGKFWGLASIFPAGVLSFFGGLLPGEALSMMGIILLGGCYVGYFRKNTIVLRKPFQNEEDPQRVPPR